MILKESNNICEWLFKNLFPSLYLNVMKSSSSESLHDYLLEAQSNNNGIQLNPKCLNCFNSLVAMKSDLLKQFNTCLYVESNLLYMYWLLNLFKPLFTTVFAILFILPLLICLYLYFASIYLFITKHWKLLKADYNQTDVWKTSFKSLCIIWETIGDIWHGHELIGFENIPDEGHALLIYYHAAMPIDFYYVYSKTLLYKNRKMKIVADKFLFKVPGLGSALEAFEVTPGTKDLCVSLLNEGNILSISPGGVREALFSDHNYEIIWGNRAGFAQVALEAKCPIIPMFTQNSREALRTFPYFRGFFRWVYEKTRLPLIPIYGLFPVKLRTYIGKPIEYDPNLTALELKALTKARIEELINRHQRLPGNIFSAILDRFRCLDRLRKVKTS